jgi:hypothetical protein
MTNADMTFEASRALVADLRMALLHSSSRHMLLTCRRSSSYLSKAPQSLTASQQLSVKTYFGVQVALPQLLRSSETSLEDVVPRVSSLVTLVRSRS